MTDRTWAIPRFYHFLLKYFDAYPKKISSYLLAVLLFSWLIVCCVQRGREQILFVLCPFWIKIRNTYKMKPKKLNVTWTIFAWKSIPCAEHWAMHILRVLLFLATVCIHSMCVQLATLFFGSNVRSVFVCSTCAVSILRCLYPAKSACVNIVDVQNVSIVVKISEFFHVCLSFYRYSASVKV